MKKSDLAHKLLWLALLLMPAQMKPQECAAPDNGSGTATLPPLECYYSNTGQPFVITNGLPPETTLEMWGTLSEFTCCPFGCELCTILMLPGQCEGYGGMMGGNGHCYQAMMQFEINGTGQLAGYHRILMMPVFCEVHTAPRMPGQPIQTCPALFYTMSGQLFEDPDFMYFSLKSGEYFGLPSPGQITLTQLPTGDWAVDSFFDITYQIEFAGAPGGPLGNYGGLSIGNTHITLGGGGGGGGGAISDLFLRIGDWNTSEEWHNWISGINDVTEIQLFAHDPEHEIMYVMFSYSLDGEVWNIFYGDEDGTQPEISTYECSATDGDGWTAYFIHEMLSPTDHMVYFKGEAYTATGQVYAVTNATHYDPSPPNGIMTNVYDQMIIHEDAILLEIIPAECYDLSYVYVEVVPKVDSFSKGVPPISQQPHSSSSCSPTAAASCLKYFESQGDGDICGGLSDDGLVDSLEGRFHTNDGHWGTYLSDIANGLRGWISDHGGGFTVRGPIDYDWQTMRNELERCQDVISSIYWDGGCGHSMTFNSVVNMPNPDGSITVDFMDPWTGEIEWGTMDPSSGHVTGFTGAGAAGTMGDMIIVCPQETSITPGGGIIFPGPFPGTITIPVPGDGLYFLRIISVDQYQHKARFDYVVRKESSSQVSNPVLCVNKYINPEPWNNWFGNENGVTPVQLLVSDPRKEIIKVDFYYTIDGTEWQLFYTDTDGKEPLSSTAGSAIDIGDGWTGYILSDALPLEEVSFTYKSKAELRNGEIIETITTIDYDPTPPSLIEMNVEDWFSTEEEEILLEIMPGGCLDLSYIEYELVPKTESFQKGIPPLNQRPHSDFHCTPTAAAACLKYFANQGDGTITGGLTDDALIEALANLFKTWINNGTYPSDLANGLLQWVNAHGGNYTVTRPQPFNWKTMRNELERCQDVITNVYWPTGGGHSMTFNSIVNRPENGLFKVDFMDPWTGQIEWGHINPATGELTGFTGAGASGEVGNIVYVCPKETTITPGTGTVVPGPFPMPEPMPIPIPQPGLYFLRIKAVDNSNHVARFDLVVEREEAQTQVADLKLRVGDWLNPEPWHNWIGANETNTPVQLHVTDPENEIVAVQFYYSYPGMPWTLFGTDEDGCQPFEDTQGNSDNDCDGWKVDFYHSMVPPENMTVYFRADALLVDGEILYAEKSVEYDPSPPNSIIMNMYDWMTIEKDSVSLYIDPGLCTDLSKIIVEVVPKADTFLKGIPLISQQEHSATHCAPAAAAACLKYFETQGDTTICGGLSDFDLVDSIAKRANTNDGHSGTFPADLASGLQGWIKDHGNNYTVRGPNAFDWKEMRNELERCQDVLAGIYWTTGGGHRMTFNSIVNREQANGKIRVDFMDPWTGEIEWGDLDENSGLVTGFTGAGVSGELDNMIFVCPKEVNPDPGTGTVYPWPYPERIPIGIHDPGLYFLRVIVIDQSNHKARYDLVLDKVKKTSVGNLKLRVGDWLNPEPWHSWIGGSNEMTEIQLFVNDPEKEIMVVNFLYSIDGNIWTMFYQDDDGTQSEISTEGCSAGSGDGWQAYFPHEIVPQEEMMLYFKAVAVTADDETFEATNSVEYDPTPPSEVIVNIPDWLITPDDQILLEVIPGNCLDLDYYWVEVLPKVDTFQKGIPPISQQPHSCSHCSPTAAAACLKYFEGEGDTDICGGLTDHELVDSLAARFHTNDGHWGTYLSDMANGLLDWINDHGGEYTVRGPKGFNWQEMRNELERCQDVLPAIWWDGGCGHSMTFNSIVNTPNADGSIRVDFMDPWTGEIEWGNLNTSTGHLAGFSGAGASGTLDDIIYVCPIEDSVTPGGGTIVPGNTITPINLPVPQMYFIRIIMVDQSGHSARKDLVVKREAPTQQGLNLFEGWQGISTNLMPENPDVVSMFEPVSDNLVILYNQTGVYWPGQNINTIGDWNVYSGYVLKMLDDETINVSGQEIEDQTVYLNEGWNLVPVFNEVYSEMIFEGLTGFYAAKAVAGTELLWPLYNINTMETLFIGKAYWVLMTEPGTISFVTGTSNKSTPLSLQQTVHSPWNPVATSANTHIVAFTGSFAEILKPTDIIGAFTEAGLCAGIAQIEYTEDAFALTLMGDDPTTSVPDGFTEGSRVVYKLFRESAQRMFELAVEYDGTLNPPETFVSNGMSALTRVKLNPLSNSHTEHPEVKIYPNPNNGLFVVEGIVSSYEIRMYSSLGEEVYSGTLSGTTQINLQTLPEGIYMVKIDTGDFSYYDKLVIR